MGNAQNKTEEEKQKELALGLGIGIPVVVLILLFWYFAGRRDRKNKIMEANMSTSERKSFNRAFYGRDD